YVLPSDPPDHHFPYTTLFRSDRITIEITGKGGHGAHPYLTVDPVLVAAHIITAVQSIVSRNVRAIDSAVISLCAMHAGDMGAFRSEEHTSELQSRANLVCRLL